MPDILFIVSGFPLLFMMLEFSNFLEFLAFDTRDSDTRESLLAFGQYL